MELLVGLTGRRTRDWKSKLAEIQKRKIDRIGLFLEMFLMEDRKAIYDALLDSCVKTTPLVHIRDDMEKWELDLLVKKFNAKYLTIHEHSFDVIKNWRGHYKNLYLEMNTDDYVAKNVKVNKIGGFCIDLSHYKVEEVKNSAEYKYVNKWKNGNFGCNHLNGYAVRRNKDVHTVQRLTQFNYLKTLPDFVFGKVAAIETFNPIKQQLKFQKYLKKFLKGKIKIKN